MKLLLIFPPFALPTYIPLGLAQLNSYIRSRNSDVKVKCLDLNLEFHDWLFGQMQEKEKKEGLSEIEKNTLIASQLFHSRPKKLFTKDYDTLGKDFIYYLSKVYTDYDNIVDTYLKKDEHPPGFLKRFIDMIEDEQPDLIGFSISLTIQWSSACFLAKEIKKIKPNIKMIFGGSSFATKAKEKFNPEFMDYMIYGEAEIAFDSLLNNLDNLDKVPSLIYTDGQSINVNQRQELPSLADVPQPDYDDYNLKRYYNPEIVIPLYISRSCAWKKCSYCIHYKTFHKYKAKTITQFCKEIVHHSKKGIRYFNIVDEMVLPEFLDRLCDNIIKQKLDIFWHCTLKPMNGFTPGLLDKMYKAGCRMITWGIESGNQKILDLMKKGTTVEDMHEILKASSAAGIKNHSLLIIGFPGEKDKEFNDTKVFLEKNRPYIDAVIASTFLLYEESEIFDNPEKFGITKIENKNDLQRHYIYEIKEGWTYDEAMLVHNANQDFFGSFNKFSNNLNTFRDQALIYYSTLD